MVVLPGGMPGSERLAADAAVLAFVRAVRAAGGYTCAICAAPIALHAAGVLAGCRATCYPSFAERLTGVRVTGAAVERDGRVITGSGPGTAALFALALAEALAGEEAARNLRQGMLVPG
jgi:4-methyl-5(b-hydroxyethyl)-thiazole monophosphate biosynthesis